MTTFFAKECQPKFQPVPEPLAEGGEPKIEVIPFLDATRAFIPFFGYLGRAFSPVKNDIQGNVDKLQKVYDSDNNLKTFTDMLEQDVERNNTKNTKSATMALLWLKRALSYITLLLRQLVDDHNSGAKTEDISGFVRKAYEDSLKCYHGWIVQKLFSVVSRAAPYRKDLLKTLALNNEGLEDEVIKDMEEFVELCSANIAAIQLLYDRLDLDSNDIV